MTLNQPKLSRAASWLCSVFVLLILGCATTEKAPKPFAAVTITGNTPGQILDATTEVFQANGYKASATAPGKLLFEKQAGGMSNFAYGSWLSDDRVWIRVKILVLPAGEMKFRLQCSAFMVRDRGGSTEEEIALSRLRRGSYQKLLDEVALRLTGRSS
jgi:hypothetical protein